MISKSNIFLVDKYEVDETLTKYRLKDRKEGKLLDYFTTSTGLLIVGSVYDLYGNNLSSDLAALNKKVTESSEYAPELTYIEQRGGDSLMYIYFDPICGPCKRLYQSMFSQGVEHMTIRWVPVAFQGEGSLTAGAGILGSENQELAFHTYMRTRNVDLSNDPTQLRKLQINNEIFLKTGHQGTPSGYIISPKGDQILIPANQLFSMF